MCQNSGLHVLLLVVVVGVLAISGETRTREKVLEPPQDGAAVHELHNGKLKGLADCGEDIYPSLCDSSAISEDCEKNSSVRQSCQFSCSPSGQLWRASWRGNLDGVNAAIAVGANPLCQKSHNELYELYDIPRPFYNSTSIHLAAVANHAVVVMALLDAGVDVDLQTTVGKTPTFYASWNNSIDALNILIGQNANVNLPAIDGETPLMAASRHGQLSAAKSLINANASLDVTGGKIDATAIHYAIRGNNEDIVLLLIEHNANVNIADSDGETPLMSATQHGQLSIVKALINANARLDVTGGWGNATALCYAAWYSSQDIALLLIEHNANVNLPASDGMTPLMAAAWHGQLNAAKSLINANASLDVTGGKYDATAIHYAAWGNNEDITLLLIEHNVNVNIVDKKRRTPLMAAAWHGQLSAAKALINANASLDVTGRDSGATALYYAVRGNNEDIVLLLIEHNANVNIADKHGRTPLMAAAWHGQLSVAKTLINANASRDVIDRELGDTALHYAARNNNKDIAILLIKSGAYTRMPNKDGDNPADEARLADHNQLAELIESYTNQCRSGVYRQKWC